MACVSCEDAALASNCTLAWVPCFRDCAGRANSQHGFAHFELAFRGSPAKLDTQSGTGIGIMGAPSGEPAWLHSNDRSPAHKHQDHESRASTILMRQSGIVIFKAKTTLKPSTSSTFSRDKCLEYWSTNKTEYLLHRLEARAWDIAGLI